MTFRLRVGGKITETVGGNYNVYVGKDIVTNAVGSIEITSEVGHFFGEPEDAPKRVSKTRIKEIELLTPLDDGSANDGSGGTQEGFVFGKTYTFKVKSFTNGEPVSKTLTKWAQKYHNLSNNQWTTVLLSTKGDTLVLTFNDPEMCGRFIYLRAYIDDEENEGELKIWHHNRFRWFDRTKVYEQIKDRVNAPWKINQGNSSLCGMAALYYAMTKRDPKAYEKLAKELFRTGAHTIETYIIKPHENALNMYDVNPDTKQYIAMDMAYIDWIVMATTRSKESLNSQFVYNGFENNNIDMIKAVNWPEMLTRMCKEVAGFESAESFDLGLLQIANKKGLSGKLNDSISEMDIMNLKIIDRKYKQGHTILMMIDSNMIEDISSYNLNNLTTNSHWVVYEGGLNLIDVGESKFVGFSIYTWGYDPVTQLDEFNKEAKPNHKFIYKRQRINIATFKSNYYGYIEVF